MKLIINSATRLQEVEEEEMVEADQGLTFSTKETMKFSMEVEPLGCRGHPVGTRIPRKT